MKGIIAWFAENHVTANLLMLFIIFAGIFIGLSIKLEIFPESSLDRISIIIEYPGASPADIEELVVDRLEKSIKELEDIDRITSEIEEDVAIIVIEFSPESDPDIKFDDLQRQINSVRSSLPFIRIICRAKLSARLQMKLGPLKKPKN